MRRPLLITCLLLGLCGMAAQAQPSRLVGRTDDKALSNAARFQLKRDAARLALLMEAGREDLRYFRVEISPQFSNEIFEALAAVQTSGLEQAKRVTRCKIHTLDNVPIEKFRIIYKRDVAWAEPLRKGSTETNSRELNALLRQYDLIIENHVKYDNLHDAITITAARPCNISALGSEFEGIEGVKSVDLGQKANDGNNIEASFVNGEWVLTYILRWDKCMDGCDKQHTWTFKVQKGGKVIFVGEKGDQVPDFLRCEEQLGNELLVSQDVLKNN